MCTAINFKTKDRYFGRNLDLDRSYGERVVVIPRSYRFSFRKMSDIKQHYAIIAMATIVENTPLLYDGMNEYGLAVAGLNFPENAHYQKESKDKDNVTPFEFIPWILGKCRSVFEAKTLLARINLLNIPFSDNIPLSPLHWMISDKESSVVVEQRRNGIYIHENPLGVLTNNPPFEYQIENLEKYKNLRADNKAVAREEDKDYASYCQGLGAVGLPGDSSSMSRFVRAVFIKENSVCQDDEMSSVGQFFHILSGVSMTRGSVRTDEESWDITGYSSCMNLDKGLYYYTTYDNSQISCINMHGEELDGDDFIIFPLALKQNINYQN